jgi:hypothetical protein
MTSVTEHNFEQADDRNLMLDLLQSLNGAKTALRRDECGDWTIFGKHGHIQTDGSDFYIYLTCRTPGMWENRKRKLPLKVTQDGDNEGIFLLPDFPTKELAATIRRLVGFRQTRSAPLGVRFSRG